MNANPALHPQTLEYISDTAPNFPNGEAVPAGNVKTSVESVPCSVHFDRHEARTYAGMPACDLVEHAKDIEAMQLEKPLRMGSTNRFQARVSEFTDGVLNKALSAYITVKNAMRLIARPLQNRVRREATYSSKPVSPKVWVTKAPTKAEWAARDEEAGYDVRGTSPTWVLRRAYRHRIKRRLELEPPLETAYRLGNKTPARNTGDFIGPPKPVHYIEVEDLHQIWPPVELPQGPKGMLPLLKGDELRELVIPCEAQAQTRNLERHDDQHLVANTAHINDLVEGYNFALEQFGEEYTCNYLQGLNAKDEAFMNWMINYHRKREREEDPRNKEPP